MVKVVELKTRAIERLEGYRDNPRSLPALVHARYRQIPDVSKRVIFSGMVQRSSAERKHKQHQMHAQHRDSCVKVLQWLIKKMDIKTRQCVFVNPTYNVRRTIYVPEISRHTGLCDRTVTRVLGSIFRAGYLRRKLAGKDQNIHHYFLTEQLFRDLHLDVTLDVLTRKMLGLEKREAQKAIFKFAVRNDTKKPQPKIKSTVVHITSNNPRPYVAKEVTEDSLKIGNSFLDQLRRRRQRPPD